jgi:UDP-N-acetylglucosamine:LPS N-acetylglucosamine transferase
MKKDLGLPDNPLIVCSIGGTSIGKSLLELCNSAYERIKSGIPDVHMIFITGPRLSPDDLNVNSEIEVRGFVPDLYKLYAASDIAIVQGGFSSTLELTALNRPFIFFPIEGHSEQEFVAMRLAKHNAGIKMHLSKTPPEMLANKVIENISVKTHYKSLDTNGAAEAARQVIRMLGIN